VSEMLRSAGLVLLAVAAAGATKATTYVVDPVASQVVVHVEKAGLLSFAGHTHEVAAPVESGLIVVDPDNLAASSVRVTFEVSALKVTGKGEPADDVPEVQETMESERVLDASRFATVTFVSREIRVIERHGDSARLRVTGDLTLHGVTYRQATEVSANISPTGVTASGTLKVKQTDFGIAPVTAAGGTVRVKDQVEVDFTLVARRDAWNNHPGPP
jgi:polyisoprenoid-binding protein YceI